MQYWHDVLDILNWLATHIPWDGVVASGVLSGLLVGPAKLIKSWFKHYEKIIITVIGIVSLTGTFLWSYVLHAYGTDPNIVALQGLAVAFGTQPFYQILVKPLSRRIAAWFTNQIASAKAIKADPVAELKTAVEPPTGLNTPPADDFTH